MAKFLDLKGTSEQSLQIQKSGARIKNVAGVLQIRNAADGANAELKAKTIKVSDSSIEWNTDAAGAGADWKMTLQRPAAGMTAALDFVMPPNYGTLGQFLTSDGAGNMSWTTQAGLTGQVAKKFDLVFGTAAGQSAFFTLPTANIIYDVIVIIDTPFDTAATVSVGIAATVDKYMTTTQNDLQGVAKDRYESSPGEAAPVAPEAVTVNFTPAAATAGAARIIAVYGGF